jgi:hypothetical protein
MQLLRQHPDPSARLEQMLLSYQLWIAPSSKIVCKLHHLVHL